MMNFRPRRAVRMAPLHFSRMRDTEGSIAAAPSAAATADDTESGGGKMFFTTSDLIARINQSVAEVSALSADCEADTPAATATSHPGGFGLRRQMPDGSTRRADAADTAVADLQSKIKQTAAVLSALSAEQKMDWAQLQRAEGNKIFARGDYTEAMDVYITCLVAMDKLRGSADTDDKGGEEAAKSGDASPAAETAAVYSQDSIEREIQLPVLLNLALCALKLGMLRKAESFCNFALETTLGADCPKAYFRRGRARMLMGSYEDARVDLERARDLLRLRLDNDANDDADAAQQEAELMAVKKELQKLERLEITARKHKKEQKKAMKKLWDDNTDTYGKRHDAGASDNTSDESTLAPDTDANIAVSSSASAAKSESQTNANVQSERGLYSDVRERRQFSTLRAKKKVEVSGGPLSDLLEEEEEDDVDEVPPTFFQWYLLLFERCLRKTLHILGDEEGARMEYPSPHDKDK